jgi:antibiotic biosynthesis monooxygenase (ABM) superfamily enzyme
MVQLVSSATPIMYLLVWGRKSELPAHVEATLSPSNTDQSATGVISHHVSPGHEPDYERWLDEIIPVAKSYPGHLGIQIIRPVPGATTKYTVIIRFDTREHLLRWMGSHDRARLIEKVQPFLEEDEQFFVRSGLDFWFTPEGAKAKLPTRWKQFLLTWSVIYPLVLIVPLVVGWALRQLAVPQYHLLNTLLVTGIVVLLMVYVIMPRYTKLVRRWLFR